MRFSRKMIYVAATPLTLAGLLATTAAAPAGAAVRPLPREAYGSVELGSPLQYETFLALQGHGRHHGVVNYTNWAYAEPGSGVYAPKSAALPLTFVYQGQQYAHTLNNGLKLIAKSTDRLAFSGTGAYSGGGTWKIAGQIKDARLMATIAYDGQAYKVFLAGKIAAGGSVSGIAKSSTGQALTFSMPAGSFVSVLHYHALIQSDQIGRHDATFQFTIPRGEPAGLAGVKVTVKVHDGGWGARHDRYAHGVTGTPLQRYPIIGGPGVTVR